MECRLLEYKQELIADTRIIHEVFSPRVKRRLRDVVGILLFSRGNQPLQLFPRPDINGKTLSFIQEHYRIRLLRDG